jgi:hypothetical protein
MLPMIALCTLNLDNEIGLLQHNPCSQTHSSCTLHVGASRENLRCALLAAPPPPAFGCVRWPGDFEPEPDSNHTVYQPGAPCRYWQHNRADILAAFAGREIVVVGDSLMRQLFVRLVHMLRGEEVCAPACTRTHTLPCGPSCAKLSRGGSQVHVGNLDADVS